MKREDLRKARDLIDLYERLMFEPGHAGNLFGFTDYGVRQELKDVLLPRVVRQLQELGVENL